MEIVSLAPSNTEILYRLGLAEEVVAVTSLCDYPSEVKEKETVGGWTRGIDFERIREIDPDLVLASDSLQNKVVEKLGDQQILQVKPNTVEEVYDSIQRIGKRTGKEEEAHEIIVEMKQQFKQVELSESKRIYCEEWMNPTMASGNWIPSLIEIIGGKSFLDEGERSRKFELENLKEFDPEYIFLNVCGAGENIDVSEVLGRKEWQNITAVKNGDVYLIDDALLNRPGPRIVGGVRKMIEKISES